LLDLNETGFSKLPTIAALLNYGGAKNNHFTWRRIVTVEQLVVGIVVVLFRI
jgi:hypothetical protein